eukprot:959242-Pelagomonas_calceolata.AAC.8
MCHAGSHQGSHYAAQRKNGEWIEAWKQGHTNDELKVIKTWGVINAIIKYTADHMLLAAQAELTGLIYMLAYLHH